MGKRTVILGASTDPSRYAYKAAEKLTVNGHEIFPVGIKKGEVFGKAIMNGHPDIPEVDTITLYVGPQNQKDLYEYITKLKPQRVIFNPGTENEDLMNLLEKYNIEVVEACTLVMLASGQY